MTSSDYATDQPAPSSAAAWSRSQHLPRVRNWVLGLLALVSLFGFIDRIIVQTLVQPIKADLHLSDLQIGLIGGLSFAVLNATLAIPIARLAERRNRVVIVTIGVALWSIATSVSAFTGTFLQLMAARIGVGIGEAAGLPAATSIIADYQPRERRATAMAIYTLGVPVGALIGGVAGGLIAGSYGWRMAFLAAGVPGLFLAALVYLTIREPQRGLYDPGQVTGADAPPFIAVVRRFAMLPSLRNAVIGATIATTGGYAINLFVAAYLARRFGLSIAQAGATAGIISSLPGIAGIASSGFLADRLGRRSVRAYVLVPAVALLITTPLYIAAFSQAEWGAFAALLMLTALFQYAYIPTTSAVVQNMTHPQMRASAAAILNLLYSLIGLGAGPLLIGLLSDRLAAAAYTSTTGGLYSACAAVARPDSACGVASATGLQQAVFAFSLLYLIGAAFMFLSARTLPHDMERANR